MNKDIKRLYDRGKSIKDNASAIGVNERTIRYFMSNNDISRSQDNEIRRINELSQAIEQLKDVGVKPTILNLQQQLKWSTTTIKKYKQNISEIGNNKLPKFNLKSKQVIKNYSFNNQSEILYNIIHLHNNHLPFEVDITYSTGGFYEKSKKFYVPQPSLAKYDIEPLFSDVIKIEPLKPLPIESNSISSLIMDLPFIIAPHVTKDNNSIIRKRFNSFENIDSMLETYYHYIKEMERVLKYGAKGVIKCQATISTSKNIFTPEFLFLCCQKLNTLYVKDQFFLIAKSVLHAETKIIKQQHARKYISVLYVIEKVKKKKVDYYKFLK